MKKEENLNINEILEILNIELNLKNSRVKIKKQKKNKNKNLKSQEKSILKKTEIVKFQ